MSNERILVIDDEPDVRKMCRRTLALSGYQVSEAGSGMEAIALCRQESFDIVLTDLKMPRMDGLETYREIREIRPDTTAVVMTGYGTLEAAIEALQLGVSEFVLKPFRPKELDSAVGRALAKQRLAEENARLKAFIPLYELSQAFMSSTDLKEIPRLVVRIARQGTRADTASLMLLDANGYLTIHSAEGLPSRVITSTQQDAASGIAGYAITHREPVIIQGNIKHDPRFENLDSVENVQSAICLPLIHQDKVLGVLNISRTSEITPYTTGDVELLSVLGSQATIAIENARMFNEIQDAYQRLSELDYLKSEFINIASHELRSPLAVVLAYATLLEDEATGPMREHLGQVVQAAMQLRTIIDDMVSLQQIDTGQAQVQIIDLDISGAITSVVDDLRPLAEGKLQKLDVHLPENLPTVKADAQVLYLILSSLLSNAIKFTAESGQITVRVAVEETRVVTTIQDNGVGIPEDELERIFQRFYQVADSLRRQHGGIGLGLAIAREMAELIDAEIRVESQVDQGSTFYLSLAR